MIICLNDKTIEFQKLKDLKSRFTVIYDKYSKHDILIEGNNLTYLNTTVDCTHWLVNTPANFSDLIDIIICSIRCTDDELML